jgi:hypothetical protein
LVGTGVLEGGWLVREYSRAVGWYGSTRGRLKAVGWYGSTMVFHAARDVICDGWHPRAARAEGRDTWLRSWCWTRGMLHVLHATWHVACVACHVACCMCCMPRGMLHAAAHLAEVPDFVDDGRRFLVGAVPATRARIQITLVHRRQRACARLTRGYACVRA